ncbi:hypothetical protein CICLE_v10003819mg, partial [Citrus x clementina]
FIFQQVERGNALFVSEEIFRIHHSFHMHQPVEIVLEILFAPNACFLNACVAQFVVCSNVKIPYKSVYRLPALCGNGISDSEISLIFPP